MSRGSGRRWFAGWALAGVAAIVVATVAASAYVLTQGRDAPSVPPAQRNPVLEQAKARGVIDDYEVVYYSWPYGPQEYLADDAVRVLYHSGRFEPGRYFLSYPVAEAEKGGGVARLARRMGLRVVVAPPYTRWNS